MSASDMAVAGPLSAILAPTSKPRETAAGQADSGVEGTEGREPQKDGGSADFGTVLDGEKLKGKEAVERAAALLEDQEQVAPQAQPLIAFVIPPAVPDVPVEVGEAVEAPAAIVEAGPAAEIEVPEPEAGPAPEPLVLPTLDEAGREIVAAVSAEVVTAPPVVEAARTIETIRADAAQVLRDALKADQTVVAEDARTRTEVADAQGSVLLAAATAIAAPAAPSEQAPHAPTRGEVAPTQAPNVAAAVQVGTAPVPVAPAPSPAPTQGDLADAAAARAEGLVASAETKSADKPGPRVVIREDAPAPSAPAASGQPSNVMLNPVTSAEWRLTAAGAARHAAPDTAALQFVKPEAIAGQITLGLSNASGRSVEIRLDPPELGRVHIHMTPTEHGMQATVMAERQETNDFLRRHAETLTRDLNAAGYDNVNLQFSTGSQAGANGGDQREQAFAFSSGQLTSAPEVSPAAPAREKGSSALDIRL